MVAIAREHSAWHAPRGRTENRRAAFEQFVLRILEHAPEIELAAGMSYGPHGFDFAARRKGKPLLVDAKQTTPQTAQRMLAVTRNSRWAANNHVITESGRGSGANPGAP